MVRALTLAALAGCADPLPAGEEHVFSAESDAIAFAVLGDVGTGYPNQHAVGEALAGVCAARAADPAQPDCALVLLVGDNVYESGANSVTDPRFVDRFEAPYADVELPFFVVGGNHDWGWHGIGHPVLWEREKLAVQIEYSQHSDKWIFPGRFWAAREQGGLVRFLGLDSTSLIWQTDREQTDWVAEQVASAAETWRFAFLHHTVLSNGRHGNAGRYPPEEGANGDALEALFREQLCSLDAVFTGHDHDLQWHEAGCGTHVIVSGAAGKSRALREAADQQNPDPLFQLGGIEDASGELATYQLGFLLVELAGDTFTGTFYDDAGEALFTHQFQRRQR